MRIAVLGAGTMGETHATAYSLIPGVEVAAVFGRTQERAWPRAHRLGTVATTQLTEVISDASLDAVDVCLPTGLHREFVVAALEAGKHVFRETPMALTIEDARAMIDVARANGRLLLIALLMRSISANQSIQKALATGEIGRPLAVHAYRLGSYLRRESRDFKEHYGDPTTELMTFDYDLLNWLFGCPIDVYAIASMLADGRPGHISATLRYADFVATVEASGVMLVGFPFSVGLRVVGGNQALEFAARFVSDVPEVSFVRHANEVVELSDDGDEPYEVECRYFVACLRREADPELLDAERAVEALRLSLATQQSIREGRAIKIAP